MIVDGVSIRVDESMFEEWTIWHGKGINAMHTACETNVPVTDGYRVPLELLIRAMLEHNQTCDRWAAAKVEPSANRDRSVSSAVGGSDDRSSGVGAGAKSAPRTRRRRATGTFQG